MGEKVRGDFSLVILNPNKWDPKWDERFSQDGFFYGKEPNDFLKDNISVFKKQGDLLCLGEGEGRNAVFLATQGFQVTAMDGSQEGFKKLALLAQEKKVIVRTDVADLVDYSMGDKKWDGIVSIWCHLSKPIWKNVLRKVAIALRPGGVFLLESYTPEQIKFGTGGPPTADWMATLSELKEAFHDFEFVKAQEIHREVHEGKAHHGPSAVVQFIAVKPSRLSAEDKQ